MRMTKKNYDNLISNFYEKCSNGEISVNQREILIGKARESFIIESVEEFEDIEDSENRSQRLRMLRETPKESYDNIKKALYERCENNEITNEERELLLEKAREELF